jgi:hypothetical protein
MRSGGRETGDEDYHWTTIGDGVDGVARVMRFSTPRGDPSLPRQIVVGGLIVMAASGFIDAARTTPTGLSDATTAAERWVLLGGGLFTALVSLILAWFVARSFMPAYWLAAAQAAVTLLGVAADSFASVGAAMPAVVGSLMTLAGLGALTVSSQLGSPRDGPRTFKPLRATVVRIILVIHLVAMLGWVANYAIFTMLAGLIGFQDFWTLPFGIAIVAGLVVAGVSYHPGSSGGRIAAASSLAGSTAASLYPLQSDQSPVTQVVIVALVVLAIAAIVVVTLEGHLATPAGDAD